MKCSSCGIWIYKSGERMANIYFISGPCGCGKSTLTDALTDYMVKVEKQPRIYVIHGDDELIERAKFLKYKLDNLPENQGHLYDNTEKSTDQEVQEISEKLKENEFKYE